MGLKDLEKVSFYSTLKGIAIFLVVLGHVTQGWINNYIYSFHIPLFFFITGALYNEKKYGHNPALLIGRKIYHNWGKYVIYTSLIGLIHFFTILESYNITGGSVWGFSNYINYMLNTMIMNNTEPLCGPTWFVAPFILASVLFSFIVYFGCKIEDIFQKKAYKHVFILLMTTICLLLGNERMEINFQLGFRLDVALFVMPILTAGYYMGTYLRNPAALLKWYLFGSVKFFL